MRYANPTREATRIRLLRRRGSRVLDGHGMLRVASPGFRRNGRERRDLKRFVAASFIGIAERVVQLVGIDRDTGQ
jgi:hypothetical protein